MCLEFLQPCHHYFRQVALRITVSNLHRFVQFSFAQSPGYCGNQLTRLLAGRAERNPTVEHHAK